MDESTKQHIEEIKTPLPTKPKVAKKYDYEYKRNGGSLLFMFFAPEHSLRKVIIDDRKRAI